MRLTPCILPPDDPHDVGRWDSYWRTVIEQTDWPWLEQLTPFIHRFRELPDDPGSFGRGRVLFVCAGAGAWGVETEALSRIRSFGGRNGRKLPVAEPACAARQTIGGVVGSVAPQGTAGLTGSPNSGR